MSHSRARFGVAVFLAVLLGAVSLPGCSGGAGATPPTTKSEAGEVGASLEVDGWVVTLVDQPELSKQVGTGTAVERTDMGEEGGGRSGMRIAEGMWLVLTVEVTNGTADLAMLPKKLLVVTDAQGNKYELAGLKIHAPLINDDDRWEDQQQNQLAQWVFDDGGTREGPLVFDVPEGVTGLKLTAEGVDAAIDLGF